MHFSAGSAVMAGSQGLSRHEKKRKGGGFFLHCTKCFVYTALAQGQLILVGIYNRIANLSLIAAAQ
jgi:hypothetical protein